MVEIKVNVQVDLSEKTIEALKGLFVPMPYYPYSPIACGIDTQCGCNVANTSQEEQKAKQPDPAPTAKVEEKPAPKPEPAKQAEAAKSSVGIEDVRKVLALKVNDHRDAIKEKLNELGAPSVTKLAKEKYQEMYDFLISL